MLHVTKYAYWEATAGDVLYTRGWQRRELGLLHTLLRQDGATVSRRPVTYPPPIAIPLLSIHTPPPPATTCSCRHRNHTKNALQCHSMRPVPTPVEGARSISRVGDADNLSSRAFSAPTAPLSCFITTEAELDSPATSPELRPCARNAASKRGRSSSPSLSDRSGHRRRQASPSLSSDAGQGISQPLTPILTGAFGPGSAISSPAVSSSVSLSEEPCSIGGSFADLPPSRLPWSGSEMGGVAGVGPQLVMPSLAVPRRRPFSEVGKTLGKLKILVTGQSGMPLRLLGD